MILFHILDLNLRSSCQIASLFVAVLVRGYLESSLKQDRPSVIIEGPHGPLNCKTCAFLFIFWPIYEKLVVNCSPCCTYVSSEMRSAFADILVPLVPLDFM